MRLTIALGLLLVPVSTLASHTLGPTHEAVLHRWLEAHPELRLAQPDDCDCASDIEDMRGGAGGNWVGVPDYNPYIAVGDFNSDGKVDFAVVLIDRRARDQQFAFAVFNGPFGSSRASPAFFETRLDLRNEGLFFGPPRPQPYRLVRGAFESEAAILEPKGKTYSWNWDNR